MASVKYWVWLSCVGGVRPLVKYRLTEELGGPERVFYAGRDEMLFAGALPGEAEKLMDKSLDTAERVLAYCEENHVQILTLQDAAYPERLRNIPDPPVVLYILGKLPPVDETLMIAVVGTRHPSPYGLRMAGRLGSEIAAGGGIVVSGLAEGCDSAAMEAALRAGGTTVGVLGTSIEKVYPARNRWLFREVRARGALVSEYAPETRTYPADFKARNRIISGLSLGVAVTEAPRRSGTRVTVDHALEQGRDVYAVPGNADHPGAAGTNELIAEGAVAVSGGGDILACYGHRYDLKRRETTATPIKKEIDKPKDIVYIDNSEGPAKSSKRAEPAKGPKSEELEKLPEAQRRVLAALTRPGMHADELIEAAGLSAAETLSALTLLQLTGYVSAGEGKRYTRNF